jgi:hypothetical protein
MINMIKYVINSSEFVNFEVFVSQKLKPTIKFNLEYIVYGLKKIQSLLK